MTRIRSAPPHELAREQPRPVVAEVEPVLEPDQVGAFGDRRAVPGAGAGGRDRDLVEPAAATAVAQQRLGHRAAAGVAGADEQNVHAHGGKHSSRREPPGGPPQLGARDGALRAPSAAPSRCSRPASTAARCRARRRRAPAARRFHRRPGTARPAGRGPAPAGRRAGWRRSRSAAARCAATSRAMPWCDVWRTAMPPSRPRSSSGSRPSPPRSTSVSGPGQNASDSARADAVNTRPHASAIARPDTSSRNGLPGSPPLEPRERGERRHASGAEPRP